VHCCTGRESGRSATPLLISGVAEDSKRPLNHMPLSNYQKIVVIAPSAPPFGGGGVVSSHFHLYRCLKQRGFDVVLLTFNEKVNGYSNSDIFRFGASNFYRSLLALFSALYLKAIGSRKTAYQLVDILFSVPGVLQLNRMLRQLRPQHIIIPDHGGPGLLLDKGDARLTLVVHHNPSRFINNPLLESFCPVDVQQAMKLEQRVLAKVDGVIAPSRYMEGVFRETFQFGGPVTMIHNLLDLSLLDSLTSRDIRSEMGLSAEAPLVYIPSAGSIFKGKQYVVDIIRRLSESCSTKIGFYLSGKLTDDLVQELKCVSEKVCIFAPGPLSYLDNLAVVKACSFGVSPTLLENFSMAILEATVCGVPMVVFGAGGTGEIVFDGENGFCVPCHDLNQLCTAALRLLDMKYCKEMSLQASSFSRKQFDADRSIDAYLKFCNIDMITETESAGGNAA
jgi:glycosyltransferase involved in cell wall biosynthesis